MIKRIISGGQTGADQGGLKAGEALCLETGGWAPYNWMTAEGPQEELLRDYGLKAAPYDPKIYPVRTRLNVKFSHGTVIFGNTSSPGCRLTLKFCETSLRPCILNPTSKELGLWIIKNHIEVLNVAGNREHKNPGISLKVQEILIETLRRDNDLL
jgi:hypothetical protein